jgi:hypothetical protein
LTSFGDLKEPTIGTLGRIDARLLAHATHPLVGAGRLVSTPACLAALKYRG